MYAYARKHVSHKFNTDTWILPMSRDSIILTPSKRVMQRCWFPTRLNQCLGVSVEWQKQSKIKPLPCSPAQKTNKEKKHQQAFREKEILFRDGTYYRKLVVLGDKKIIIQHFIANLSFLYNLFFYSRV